MYNAAQENQGMHFVASVASTEFPLQNDSRRMQMELHLFSCATPLRAGVEECVPPRQPLLLAQCVSEPAFCWIVVAENGSATRVSACLRGEKLPPEHGTAMVGWLQEVLPCLA